MARKKVDIKDKQLYQQFVYLSDAEYSELSAMLGKTQADRWIDELNGAIGQHGYKYTSHYWTIRNWARRAEARNSANSSSGTSRSSGSPGLNGFSGLNGLNNSPGSSGLNGSLTRVLEALRDPANRTMPSFDDRTRAALYKLLTARKMNWPRLHEQRHDPEFIEQFRSDFTKAYQTV